MPVATSDTVFGVRDWLASVQLPYSPARPTEMVATKAAWPPPAGMKRFSILAALLTSGCSSENETRCEKYADMEIKCGGLPADEHEVTHKMASGFCQKALGGDDMLNLAPEIECSRKHSDCSGYTSCTDESEAFQPPSE